MTNKLQQKQSPPGENEILDLLDTAPMALHWCGADGTILWANRAEMELLGYRYDEYVGHNITEFVCDPSELDVLFDHLARNETLHNHEVRFRAKDGSTKHVSVSSNAYWRGGKFKHTRCFLRDVSDRKRIECQLRDSKRRFSAIFNQVTAGIAETDLTGQFVLVNDRYCSIVGRRREELLALTMQEITHPDDAPGSVELFERMVQTGTPFTVEKRYVRPDGTLLWLHNTMSLLCDEDGRPEYAVAISTDITHRRRAEERQLVLAAANAGLAGSVDCQQALSVVAKVVVPSLADCCAIFVMPGGPLRAVEVSHNSAIPGVDLQELVNDYRPSCSCPDHPISAVLREGEPIRLNSITDQEVEMFAASPRQRELWDRLGVRSVLVVPLTARGRQLGALGLGARDPQRFDEADAVTVAEIGRRLALAVDGAALLESERRARCEAEAANRSKDEFLAMLGHELRNPLSPVLGALHLIRLRCGEAAGIECAIIERQVRHLVRLINDLLDVSRLTRGKIELHKQPANLASLLAKAIEIAKPLFDEKQQEFITADLSDRELWIEADEQRLVQAVANLLTNAAKYTAPGGKIEMSTTCADNAAVLRIRDNGVGISPHLLPRLFDLFVQGERSLDRSQGGLGLGLALVHRVITMHGGTVTAASDGPGRGSEFSLTLPLVARPLVQEQNRSHTPTCDVHAGRRRILVVDDNRDAATTLAAALSASGHVARAAFEGPTGLVAARDLLPEVALLDIGLPAMDGYELARRLRELPGLASVKLVAVTGYGQSADRLRSENAGFDAHLVKPIHPDQIERVLSALFAG
jgi:PAS domain S-box-containing protein